MSSLVSLRQELADVMAEWDRMRTLEKSGRIHSQWKYARKITELQTHEAALRALIAEHEKAGKMPTTPQRNLSQEA